LFRLRAPSLLASLALLATAPLALAETKTFGADLARPANGALTCAVLPGLFQLPSGAGSCTWWSMQTFAATNESHLAPYPGGVVTRVRVKAGPTTGPTRIDVIRLRRHALFTGEAACCFATGVSSPVFTPAPDAITTLDVNLPVKHELNAVTNTWDFDTLALSVLSPGVPIPMHDTGQQSYYGPASGALYPHFDQTVEQRTNPHGVPGYQVLMSADIELAATTAPPTKEPQQPQQPQPDLLQPKPVVDLARAAAPVRGNDALVRLICGLDTVCNGILRLQNRAAGQAGQARTTAAQPALRTYGAARIRIAAHGTVSVRVRLNRHGRRLVRTKKQASVYANVRLAGRAIPGMRLTLVR
jgi:hypothetical protein